MKLGTFMMPLHPPGRSPADTLVEDREAILLAERLGYAEAFVGEHVTDLAENVTSCLMFLASLAHETKSIVLGSGTINMPNSHPAAIAAQVAMLDHMLKGRFIMGISPGGLMSDAEVFGNYQKDRNAIFLESINMVKRPCNMWSSIATCAAIAAGWLFGMLMVPLPSTMFFVSCATLARNIRHEVTFSARSVTCSPT